MPRIVILDGYTTNPGDNPWDPIREFGNLEVYDRTPEGEILQRARGAEILLTNKTPLRRDVLEQLDDLGFIALLATGYDVVDVDYARDRGIPVSNVPEYGAQSVAEHAIALLLELAHKVGMHHRAVQRGEWCESPDFTFWNESLTELGGKTMGIVGYGDIGARVGRIASAFGMRVLASTHSSKPNPDYGPFERVDNDELFRRSDVVSLHCPLTDTTRDLIDASRLDEMKDSAFLVNTARGELVVEEDLVEALESGEIAGAAVDVVSKEPMEPDNPLLDAPRCVITPHNAWTSIEARRRLMNTTAENIEAYLAGEPINLVNG